MTMYEFEVRIKLQANQPLTEQSIQTEFERVLRDYKQASIASTSIRTRRRKPSLVSARRQFKIAIAGGWAMRVPLEPVTIGKSPKFATTIGEAVANHLIDGASMFFDLETFVVLRLKSRQYIAIGMHKNRVLFAPILGKPVVTSPR